MKWIGLLALLIFASLLIGYGLLPILGSDTSGQEHLVGWAMISAGAAIVSYVVLHLRARPR